MIIGVETSHHTIILLLRYVAIITHSLKIRMLLVVGITKTNVFLYLMRADNPIKKLKHCKKIKAHFTTLKNYKDSTRTY